MPLYDFKCLDGHIFERFVPLAKFKETQLCSCGMPSKRIISSPMISVDYTDYQCPVTGIHIGSKRAHEENLKRTDCRVRETGETKINQQRRKEAENAFEKRVDESVERQIDGLSSDKREKLYNEMVNQDLTIERGTAQHG